MTERELNRNQITQMWHMTDSTVKWKLRNVTPSRVSEKGRVKYYNYADVVAVLGPHQERSPRAIKAKSASKQLPLTPRLTTQPSRTLSLNGNVNATIVFLRGADRERAERLAQQLAGGDVPTIITLALEFLAETFSTGAAA